ncbi:hypothetical protein Lepto7375DRAFT_3346 [Leptolyngbya sp. PCC 7375]|nr:hypothetical protein Lepto7375DRAFT_3346 [Leptolyngbya sp. PCC 7375]
MTQDELLEVIEEAARTGRRSWICRGGVDGVAAGDWAVTQLETLQLGWKIYKGQLIWNQLSALPPEIVQLTSLQTLDLSKNQLSALSMKMGCLPFF